MAISFIGVNTSDQAGALALSLVIPAAATTDDFMVAFVKQSENTTQRIWDDDGGGGNGWTQLDYNRTTGGRDQETSIYWKIHSGSESNPTFTWASGVTAEPMSGSLMVYRGTDLTNPIQDWAFMEAQNDANPPNPAVNVSSTPATIICFHAATHDDISAVSPPTGFALRSQVWSGTSNDHRNHFTADLIGLASAGSYTPPDWQHSNLNNTPEYHTYTLALQEPLLIAITDQGDEQLDTGDTDELLDGFGFEATQGTGLVEIGDNANYATATKVAQTINSWSDTQIDFDPVFTGFSDGVLYLFVTNDNGDRSAGYPVNFGVLGVGSILQNIGFDIIHSFNNTYADLQGVAAANSLTSSGTFGFVAEPGARGTTHSWSPSTNASRIEMLDTTFTNITVTHTKREICGWIKLSSTNKNPVCIWEEGGGVNNLYFAFSAGNYLFFNVADSSNNFKVQAYWDFPLSEDRWYNILGRFEGSAGIAGVEIWVDGIKGLVSAGDLPITSTVMALHSGDYCYGDPDGNLDTGGTDIAYTNHVNARYSYWATASEFGGGAPLTDTQRRVEVFEKCAPVTDSITSDTELNMQAAVDVIAPFDYVDLPLPLKINKISGGGDLRIELDNVTFDDRCSIHVQWMGTSGQTLTIVNNGTSNTELAMCSTPYGGTVVIENPATLTISGVINGAELRIYDNDGAGNFGTELSGIEVNSGTSYTYAHSGAINDTVIQMLADGYEEVLLNFELSSQDQLVTLTPIIETN